MRILGMALIVFSIGATDPTAHQVAAPTQQPPVIPTPQQPVPTAPAPTPADPTAVPGQLAGPVALPVDRVFAAEAGMIFNPIRPDKVPEFEMVLDRIHEALSKSTDTGRRAQAVGWKVFKAVEPGPNGSTLYVFAMDPAVPKADYTVSKILADAYPMEVRELYKLYIGAFAAPPSLLNLKPLDNFGTPYTPKPVAPAAVPPKPAEATPTAVTPIAPKQ